MRAATEGHLPPVMPQGNLVEVLGREVRKGSPGELMVESSPSRQRLPPCKTSGGGLHEMGKGSVRAVIASEGYLSDDEFRLHDMHVHDHVFITKKGEHVEEISMKQ